MNTATRILAAGLVAAFALVARPACMHAQRADTVSQREPVEPTDSTALVPAFRYIERSDRTEFSVTDINNPPITKALTRLPNFPPNNCAERQLRSGRLDVKLERNDDYEYAGTANFTAAVKFRVSRVMTGGATVPYAPVTLTIDQNGPEQLYHIDYADSLNIYELIDHFDIKVMPPPPVAITQDLRLVASYHDTYAVDAHRIGDPTAALVEIQPIRPQGGIKRTNPVLFQWDLATSCVDTFPNYQFQLLRLHNTDTSAAYTRATDAHTKVKAVVDWSQALTVETGGSKRELKLTLAEGTGYYIWRVRPIGNVYDGELADDRNWGVWSTSPADGDVLNFTSPTDANLPDYAFYYHQFDNDKNWSYSRAFTEGLRVAEGMVYANRSLQAEQTQVKAQSDAHVLVNQTVYDNTGRAAVQSLAAPVDSADAGYFGYMDSPLMVQQGAYRAKHFDNDNTITTPTAADAGAVQEYFSSANADKTVGDAEGYPFAQVRFYGDGTGRALESGSVGKQLSIAGNAAGRKRSAKVYYSGVSSMELVDIFGDEAPADTSVYKVLSLSPNKVTNVQYYSKEGQVIATCLQAEMLDTLLMGLDYERGATGGLLIRDTIAGRRRTGVYEFNSSKRLSFTQPTTVELNYEILPDVLEESGCANLCKTCDYEVTLIVHDVEKPENTVSYPISIPQASCTGVEKVQRQYTLTLAPGTYVFERRMRTNNLDPLATGQGPQTYAEKYRQEVVAQYKATVWGFDSLAKVQHFLSEGKLDSLYIYLGVNPDVDTVKVIEGQCCPVRVPILPPDCGSDPCRDSVPNFEAYLVGKWGDTFGGDNKTSLNKYFRSGGADQYPTGDSTYPNGTGAFNALVANMLAERDNGNPVYDCAALFNCWKLLVDNYQHLATTDGNPEHRTKGFSLLESFLDCTGRRLIDTAHQPYDATRGYLLFAYKYINYTPGSNTSCEAYAGYNASWHNNPAATKDWDSLYECLRAGLRFGSESDAGSDLKTECDEAANGDRDKADDCATHMRERIEGACKATCDADRDMYISAIVQGYHDNNMQYTWDQVVCVADALIDSCKRMCSLTVTRENGNSGHITGLGVQADFDRMDTVYNYELEIAPKGQGDCASGWHGYSGWHRDYKSIILNELNQRLERFRADTVGAGGGNWNVKRVLREVGIPNDILNTITDSLVFVQPGDDGRFQAEGGDLCELWYRVDPQYLGTPINPHPLVAHLNNMLDDLWGFEVDPADAQHDYQYKRVSHLMNARHYGGDDDQLPADFVALRDDYLGAAFENVNGSADPRVLGDFLTYNNSMNAWAFQFGPTDPYHMAYVDLKFELAGHTTNRVRTVLIGVCAPVNPVANNYDCTDSLDYVSTSQYTVVGCNTAPEQYGDFYFDHHPANFYQGFFSAPYTSRIGRFEETSDHYLVYKRYMRVVDATPTSPATVAFDYLTPDSVRLCNVRFFIDRSKRICTDICETADCPAICFRWVKPSTEIGIADTIRPETCRETVVRKISESLNRQVSECAESKVLAVKEKYIQRCADPMNVRDLFVVNYQQDYYHFTLYYYDRAGNLVRTVAPKGTQQGWPNRLVHPPHNYLSKYEYNSFGQPTWQNTPDEGDVRYWYDTKGRIRFVMSAQQALAGAYTYVKYDQLGRVIETGRGSGANQPGMMDLNVDNPAFPAGGSERTRMVYSSPAPTMGYLDGSPQHNLQNNLSYTFTDDGAKTYFSYDVHGNIEWVAQEIPGFHEVGSGTAMRKNYTRYTYDLISGNVNRVDYNEGRVDQFHHRFAYDADNRLVKVETSRDGQIWDRDAGYAYNALGALRRLELGEDKVQGLDYVYTPQGWLKAINHVTLDSAKDPGADAPTVNRYPADSFALELRYFEGDFKHTGSQYNATAPTARASTPLFDGTVTSAATHIGYTSPPNSMFYEGLAGETYRYDRLGRIDTSRFFAYDKANATWLATDEYLTSYRYDANGNIDSLHRNAYPVAGTPLMDKQHYNYQASTNKLTQIAEDPAATPGRYPLDIDGQGANNYTYDADGNTTAQVSNNAPTITWDNNGRVKSYTQNMGPLGSIVHTWLYDANGDRIKKTTSTPMPAGGSAIVNTYYVRDAAGVVMAIYTENCTVTPIVPIGPDTDLDGFPDAVDNCPTVANTIQSDIDHDGIGDDCDTDIDADGFYNTVDNCPYVANPTQDPVACLGDADGDGILDAADACPVVVNAPNGPDANNNGIPDICDPAFVRNYVGGVHTDCAMRLAELPIYGLGRVGSCLPDIPLTDTVPTLIFTRKLWQKQYELKDNLGNERVVISDAKLAKLSNAGVPELFHADVRDYNNYYPFGMEQPGRSLAGAPSRYGYNGMECDGMDNSAYNTFFREYDARVGRWWATDPKTHAWESPYAAMANNPVMYTDALGAEPGEQKHDKGGKKGAEKDRRRSDNSKSSKSNGPTLVTPPLLTTEQLRSYYRTPALVQDALKFPMGFGPVDNPQDVKIDGVWSYLYWLLVNNRYSDLAPLMPPLVANTTAHIIIGTMDDFHVAYTTIANRGDGYHLGNTKKATPSEQASAFLSVGLTLIPMEKLTELGAEVVFRIARREGGMMLYQGKTFMTKFAAGCKEGDWMLRMADWTWEKNEQLLLDIMEEGKPIFDSYHNGLTGVQLEAQGNLLKERIILEQHGWTYSKLTRSYHPPVRKVK